MGVCGGGHGGCLNPQPSLVGSVIIDAKTTVHCSPDSSMEIMMYIFCTRYDNGDVKVWDLRQMKECWETTVGRCLF